jgi:hypothetical protein
VGLKGRKEKTSCDLFKTFWYLTDKQLNLNGSGRGLGFMHRQKSKRNSRGSIVTRLKKNRKGNGQYYKIMTKYVFICYEFLV